MECDRIAKDSLGPPKATIGAWVVQAHCHRWAEGLQLLAGWFMRPPTKMNGRRWSWDRSKRRRRPLIVFRDGGNKRHDCRFDVGRERLPFLDEFDQLGVRQVGIFRRRAVFCAALVRMAVISHEFGRCSTPLIRTVHLYTNKPLSPGDEPRESRVFLGAAETSAAYQPARSSGVSFRRCRADQVSSSMQRPA